MRVTKIHAKEEEEMEKEEELVMVTWPLFLKNVQNVLRINITNSINIEYHFIYLC